jgi:hypothetical protein
MSCASACVKIDKRNVIHIHKRYKRILERSTMRKLILLLVTTFTLFACKNAQEEMDHKAFLNNQTLSAKDYVISLFESNDIVILCERSHMEFTQYELFLEIARDSFFINNVGNIYTEVGVANMDDKINIFLQSNQPDSISSRKEITKIFRDIDFTPYWHCYNFPWFLNELYTLNQDLPKNKKIKLHPVDASFNWANYKTALEYKKFDNSLDNRDSIMANNIIQLFNEQKNDSTKRKKALIIMNYRHSFLKDYEYNKPENGSRENVGRYLADKYGDQVSSVYIMGLAIPKQNEYTVVKGGKWDALFEKLHKTNIGFNLKNSPFGIENFDVIPIDFIKQQYTYEEMFTGLIFYKPINEHKLMIGWKDFVTEDFEPEIRRRTIIFNEAMERNMNEKQLNDRIWINNIEQTFSYSNLDTLRKQIDFYKNGL